MTTARSRLRLVPLLLVLFGGSAAAQFEGWKHSGSVWVLTTPDGADLPAAAEVRDFPLLVRLHKDFFDFRQTKAGGADLRFASAKGEPLAYQIEEWDPTTGVASVWVRVPRIVGNARQEINLHWGNPGAKPESGGKAVFNASNGYVGVWHMNGAAKDELGTLDMTDAGTTPTAGVVGAARHFPGGKGVFGGDKIPDYPAGAGSHTTEAWVRAEKPNVTVIGWGNEGGGRGSKVRMQLRSPPHLHIDSDFSDVRGEGRVPLGEWVHVAHTYDREDGRVYVNGRLDGSARPLLNIKSPARFWVGGWYGSYDFVGDIDEVRVSKVARSADWLRLQYENQKPMQTLVGPVVPAGDTFSVSETALVVQEGRSATVTARAGGAQKVYWVVSRGVRETVAAVDRLSFTFDAGRVVGDESATVRFKAVYPSGVQSRDIGVTVREAVPEPAFTLTAPATWDGRTPLELAPAVTNLAEMKARGAGELTYRWSVTGFATVHDAAAGKLTLRRAMNSGAMTVAVAVGNGGVETVRNVTVAVTEPASDAWVARPAATDEKPEDGQFFPRDDRSAGTVVHAGTLQTPADSAFVRLYAGDKLIDTATQPLTGKAYSLSVTLKPGLVKYRTEFGTKAGDAETVLHTAANLVCGDAFVIDGQSNAEATDVGKDDPPFTSDWIRSYGSMGGDPAGGLKNRWGNAVVRSRAGGRYQIGYWGMELARRIVDGQKVPVCVINGAVGGSRIDQHQRNPADPTDATTTYGRLLWRVRQAKLTHGVRAVLWHQGENDQGADGPTGGYGHETYRPYFLDMAAGWKRDYPNVRHYYVFQIWPKACSMGVNGSDNRLREVQRQLATQFSHLRVMSTLGVRPPGGCHFPPAGYAEFARLIGPLVERDIYGVAPAASITAPDLKRVSFAGEKRDELVLDFDQPVRWDDALVGQFSLDGQKGMVASGKAAGNALTLKLTAATTAKALTYLDSAAWSQDKLLRGANGIAALTFCEVPIAPRRN